MNLLVPLRSETPAKHDALRRALAAFETVCRINKVTRVTEEDVLDYLRMRGGDDLAARFDRKYLTELQTLP